MTRKSNKKKRKSKRKLKSLPIKQLPKKSFLSKVWAILGAFGLISGLVFSYISFAPKVELNFLYIPTKNPINQSVSVANKGVFDIHNVTLQYQPHILLSSWVNTSYMKGEVPVSLIIKPGRKIDVVKTSFVGVPKGVTIIDGEIYFFVSYRLAFIPIHIFTEKFTYSAFIDENKNLHWVSK